MGNMVFKVGDRVSVETYSGASWMTNQRQLMGIHIEVKRGTIVSEKNGGYLVQPDKEDRDHESICATPRMLRRLKPKKRREFWVRTHTCGYIATLHDAPITAGECRRPTGCVTEIIHVVETRNDGQSTQKAMT